jgi:hypothetical protein
VVHPIRVEDDFNDLSMSVSFSINLNVAFLFHGDCLTSHLCCIHVCRSSSTAVGVFFKILSSFCAVTLHTCPLRIHMISSLPEALIISFGRKRYIFTTRVYLSQTTTGLSSRGEPR